MEVLHVSSNGKPVLETYDRFLDPIVNNFLGKTLSETERTSATRHMDTIHTSYIARVTACTKTNRATQ
jgi:hypothetical protein